MPLSAAPPPPSPTLSPNSSESHDNHLSLSVFNRAWIDRTLIICRTRHRPSQPGALSWENRFYYWWATAFRWYDVG